MVTFYVSNADATLCKIVCRAPYDSKRWILCYKIALEACKTYHTNRDKCCDFLFRIFSLRSLTLFLTFQCNIYRKVSTTKITVKMWKYSRRKTKTNQTLWALSLCSRVKSNPIQATNLFSSLYLSCLVFSLI